MRRVFNRKVLAAAFAVLLLLGGSVWGILRLSAEAQMAKVRDMSKSLRGEDMRSLPEDQRREAYQNLRAEYEKLDEAQQRQLREERYQRYLEHEEEEMDEYFALPPEQRLAALDDSIRRSEERRQEWEARRAQRERERANQPRPSPQTQKGASGNSNGQASDKSSGRRRSRSEEERDVRRKQRLDRTSPEYRAKRTEYRRQRAERRKALGLPERSSRRGRGR